MPLLDVAPGSSRVRRRGSRCSARSPRRPRSWIARRSWSSRPACDAVEAARSPGSSTAAAARSSRLRYRRGPASSSELPGSRRATRRSSPSPPRRAGVRAPPRGGSAPRTGSSSTTAPTPASASRRTPSSVFEQRGRRRDERVAQRQTQVGGRQVHQRSLRGVGRKPVRRRGSPSPRRSPSAGRPPPGPGCPASPPRPGGCCASSR